MKEALKLALEALQLVSIEFVCNGAHHAKKDRHDWLESCPIVERYQAAITAIKEALAQPEQEPAAFSCLRCVTPKKCAVHGCSPNTWPSESSPKRPWAGLTDEPTYTEQQIANACWAAEISDSKCESLLIALQEAAHNIGVNT